MHLTPFIASLRLVAFVVAFACHVAANLMAFALASTANAQPDVADLSLRCSAQPGLVVDVRGLADAQVGRWEVASRKHP